MGGDGNIRRKNSYVLAQHLRILPKVIPSQVRRIVGIDPGEVHVGIAVYDERDRSKRTESWTTRSFEETIEKLVLFLRENIDASTDLIGVEVTYLTCPSVAFGWQLVGIVRFLYPSIVAAATPTEAAAKGLGYGRLKYAQKKKLLARLGWKGLRNSHEVAAATIVEWVINYLLRRLL